MTFMATLFLVGSMFHIGTRVNGKNEFRVCYDGLELGMP